jgi:predicted RNA-binding protein (virulence factor B family)
MSSSVKKATAKDEEDLKAFTKAKEEQTSSTSTSTVPKTDVKGLQKELGPNFTAFALGDETYRKRLLKDEYAAKKLKYGWLYDQPIRDV